MERSWWRTLAALLAGAGLAGVAQGLVAGSGGPVRFFVAALVLSNWAAAGILALGLGAATLAGRRRLLPAPGTAFWLGVAAGAAPLAATLTRAVPLWAAAGVLVAVAAPRLGRLLRLRPLHWPVTVLLGAGVAAAAFLPVRPPRTVEEMLRLPPAVGAASPSGTAGAEAPSGPDLILISLDTLRADAVAGGRPEGLELPTFDRLRREGLSADHLLSCSNQTVPGHVGMLTGLDAMEHGVRSNWDFLPGRLRFVAERFREAGWRTAAVVSHGLLVSEMGWARGFELYDDSGTAKSPLTAVGPVLETRSWLGWILPEQWAMQGLKRTLFRFARARAPAAAELKEAGLRGRGRVTTDHALAVLDQLVAQDDPYFLFLHYFDPHHPYGPPPPFQGTLTGDLPPLAAPFAPRRPGDPIKIAEIEAVQEALGRGEATARAAAEHYHRAYLETVAFVDSLLGEVLARVEAGGRPTVVLVTGDHGEQFGEHGLMLHANSLYEELLRVPLLVWGAGVPRGQEVEGEAHMVDVVPTLLSLAGLDTEGLTGRPVHLEIPERAHVSAGGELFGIRRQGWKWIAGFRAGRPPEGLHLFHLVEDPAEAVELLAARELPAGLEAEAAAALDRDQHQSRTEPLSDLHRAALDELGYGKGAMGPQAQGGG